MKILFAPMEGIAHWVYRSAQHACFDGADEYFLPFWSPRGQSLTHREQADALPENNAGMKAVPQILSNSSEDFLWAAEKLKKLGYAEANSNLDEPAPCGGSRASGGAASGGVHGAAGAGQRLAQGRRGSPSGLGGKGLKFIASAKPE